MEARKQRAIAPFFVIIQVIASIWSWSDRNDFNTYGLVESLTNSPPAIAISWALRSATWMKNQFGVGHFSDFVPDLS
jgi:hypothetical protein